MLTPQQLAILAELRKDSRIGLAEIGRRTGLASSTVFDQYQRIKERVIRRHVTLPDFRALGYPLRKQFLLRTGKRAKALAWLTEQQAVNNLYRIDTHDAMFDACFRDANEAELFKEALRRALRPKELREHDILEELKREAFTPLPGRSW